MSGSSTTGVGSVFDLYSNQDGQGYGCWRNRFSEVPPELRAFHSHAFIAEVPKRPGRQSDGVWRPGDADGCGIIWPPATDVLISTATSQRSINKKRTNIIYWIDFFWTFQNHWCFGTWSWNVPIILGSCHHPKQQTLWFPSSVGSFHHHQTASVPFLKGDPLGFGMAGDGCWGWIPLRLGNPDIRSRDITVIHCGFLKWRQTSIRCWSLGSHDGCWHPQDFGQKNSGNQTWQQNQDQNRPSSD